MSDPTEIGAYLPHINVQTDDGNVHMIPESAFRGIVAGLFPPENLGSPVLRQIISEWFNTLKAKQMNAGRQWPFVESPGEFTARLAAAMEHFPLLGAVRNVLIENPPTLATISGTVDATVVGEYIESRNAYENATRPLNSHASARQLKHHDSIKVRYRDARSALTTALNQESPK